MDKRSNGNLRVFVPVTLHQSSPATNFGALIISNHNVYCYHSIRHSNSYTSVGRSGVRANWSTYIFDSLGIFTTKYIDRKNVTIRGHVRVLKSVSVIFSFKSRLKDECQIFKFYLNPSMPIDFDFFFFVFESLRYCDFSGSLCVSNSPHTCFPHYTFFKNLYFRIFIG